MDLPYKIYETILIANDYANRDEVLDFGYYLYDLLCDFGKISPNWRRCYKEAMEKLNNLTFEEMYETMKILRIYAAERKIEEEKMPKACDDGENYYNDGMKYFELNEYERAAAAFCFGAMKGNEKALYNYGICLYTGTGTTMDKVKAIKNIVLASECGVPEAEKFLKHAIIDVDIANL